MTRDGLPPGCAGRSDTHPARVATRRSEHTPWWSVPTVAPSTRFGRTLEPWSVVADARGRRWQPQVVGRRVIPGLEGRGDRSGPLEALTREVVEVGTKSSLEVLARGVVTGDAIH